MRGHIRRRGSRSWAVVIDIGRDRSGKRRQQWHSVKGLKEDAENKLIELLRSLRTGEYVEPSKLTVEELLKQWLRDVAKASTSGKTYERYAEIVDTHLIPALGHHRLAKLQPLHIQEFYAEALRSGRRDGRGGLSRRSVVHLHRVLHLALRQAVRWQLLARNPAEAVDPPRPRPREMRVLDEDQMGQLLRLAVGTPFYVAVLLAVTTGMRRGEILALTWADIDFKAGNLVVTKSLEQTRAGLTIKAPKTAKGRRTIPLPGLAINALRRQKVQQAKQRLVLGSPDDGTPHAVCPALNGGYLQPDALSRQFRAFIKASGLQCIRFHDLRHTHATQLLRQGVHPKVVSERLGHAGITITLDTYSHVVPGLQEDAARRLDSVLRRAIRKSETA